MLAAQNPLDGCLTVVYASHMSTTTEPDLSKLEKIRALLDKAESTAAEFPQEAEALTDKAVEMMTRYRIDEAMIADAAPLQDRGKIIETRMLVGSGPYVNARVNLANAIARAHSVKLLTATGWKGKTVYLIGYEIDVALTEMLYTSLLVQATSALSSSDVKALKPGYEHGTAFNRSFLLSFADRIGERLRESTDTAMAAPHGPGVKVGEPVRSVALVLADRKADVEADVLRRYGKLRSSRPTTGGSSWVGGEAGRSAASQADLGTNRRVTSNTRKSLSA